LQERCALFGKSLLGFGVVFYILGMAVFAARAGGLGAWFGEERATLGLIFPALACLYWQIMRRVTWTDLALNVWDAVVVAGLCVVMVATRRSSDSVLAVGSLAAGFATLLAFRAIVIPSSGWRTATVGVLCAVPVFWSIESPGEGVAAFEAIDPEHLAAVRSMISPWVVIGVVVSTVASNVIYGLRKEVAKARKLGNYELQTRLGAGGMGEVYRASHALLRRPTAIKLIRPEMAGEEALKRFEAEVQSTASLTHPNTVSIYDYGRTPDGVFYYAMEFLDGFDLQDLVERFGVMPPGRVIRVLQQVAASLEEAHSMEFIHRDIKPANIVLTRRGGIPDVVKVVDFGLVKDVREEAVHLTAADSIMGTPQYLAPETIREPSTVTSSIDIYALGGVGFFLLTGSAVFQAETVMSICAAHLEQKPQRPSARVRKDLPDDLQDLILRCLAKDPADRPAARQLSEELLRCADAESWSREDSESWWLTHRPDRMRSVASAPEEPESSDLAASGSHKTVIIDQSADRGRDA